MRPSDPPAGVPAAAAVRPAPPLAVLVGLVAVGGAAGGAAREALALLLAPVQGLPVATLAANLLGCLALGLLVGAVGASPVLRPLLGTGLLGGFTTFSTLALEVDRAVAVAPVVAVAHLALNTAGGLALAALGRRTGRAWRGRRDGRGPAAASGGGPAAAEG